MVSAPSGVTRTSASRAQGSWLADVQDRHDITVCTVRGSRQSVKLDAAPARRVDPRYRAVDPQVRGAGRGPLPHLAGSGNQVDATVKLLGAQHRVGDLRTRGRARGEGCRDPRPHRRTTEVPDDPLEAGALPQEPRRRADVVSEVERGVGVDR